MSDLPDKENHRSHIRSIQDVYRSRDTSELGNIYNPLRAENVRIVAERQRVLTDLLRGWLGQNRLADKDILEIGCGTGGNLLNFIALGADPARLTGNDLMATRINEAHSRLPSSVRLYCGDAADLDIPPLSFDVVLQSVCFSSILNDSVLATVADRVWSLLRPGGIFLSYDFTIDNPRNKSVRGISINHVRRLFPEGIVTARSVTLAPPIARRVWSGLYPLMSALPFLRTHAWCLVSKPDK